MTEEQAHQWLAEGRIVHQSITPGSRVKIPRYKRYADESLGRPALDNWTEIGALNSQARESTGYPTQKPIALLERILKASSNQGDIVLYQINGISLIFLGRQRAYKAPNQRQMAYGIWHLPIEIKLICIRRTRLNRLPHTVVILSAHYLPSITDRTETYLFDETDLEVAGSKN